MLLKKILVKISAHRGRGRCSHMCTYTNKLSWPAGIMVTCFCDSMLFCSKITVLDRAQLALICQLTDYIPLWTQSLYSSVLFKNVKCYRIRFFISLINMWLIQVTLMTFYSSELDELFFSKMSIDFRVQTEALERLIFKHSLPLPEN